MRAQWRSWPCYCCYCCYKVLDFGDLVFTDSNSWLTGGWWTVEVEQNNANRVLTLYRILDDVKRRGE